MATRRARLWATMAATTAVVSTVVAGCGDGEDTAAESPPATSEAEATTTVATSESTATDDPSGSTEDGTDASSASPTSGAGAADLAIEQRHPNGSVLTVTSLVVDASSITVGIVLVNGATRDFGLTIGGAGGVSLTDDLGGVYEFIEPAQNAELLIQQRGTLTGELVYFGVLDPEAETLRLQTNATTSDAESGRVYDTASEDANEIFPHFSVEIPLDD